MNPTLSEFLDPSHRLRNSWVRHPGFRSLYVRKGTIGVTIENYFHFCENTLTVANVEVLKQGQGTFTRLVENLIGRGWAVYVECVQNNGFKGGLLRMGFIQVNKGTGYHYLKNYAGHLSGSREIAVSTQDFT